MGSILCLCDQSYKHSTIVIYKSRAVQTRKLPRVRFLSCKLQSSSVYKIGHWSPIKITRLVTSQVFDDVCTELAMAILQFWQGKPSEEQVFRTLKAMNKFCIIAHREVPQLIKMIGPEPSKFAKMSDR